MTDLAISFIDTRSRRSDPATSKAAARNAERFASTHAGRILDALKRYGPLTAHELSLLVGLTVVQIDRRLPELSADNLAHVMKHNDGADVVRGGFRVWRDA